MSFLKSLVDGYKNGQADLANYHNNFDKYIDTQTSRTTKDDTAEMAVYDTGNVSWVNIALNRKMLDISNIDYYFVDKEGKKIEWDKVPEDLRIGFDNGFAGMGINELISIAAGQEDLTGNALWIKDVDNNVYSKKNNVPYGLIPITPGKFKININTKGTEVTHYTVTWRDGTRLEYAAENVIHFKRNSLINPFVGIGLISQGNSLVDFESVAMDYQITFLEKDGTPDLIYLDKNMTNPAMAASKQKELVSNYKSGKYSQSLMYAYGDIDIKSFSISSSDLQFIENRGLNQGQIISLMESTGSVLGVPDANNRASADKLTNNYFGIVNSRAAHLLDAINKQYLWTMAGNETKQYTLSFTPYPTGEIDQLTKAVNSGIITPANASKNLGYEYDLDNEASNTLYISKGVGTLQSNFETEPISFQGALDSEIENVKKKTLIRDYIENQ